MSGSKFWKTTPLDLQTSFTLLQIRKEKLLCVWLWPSLGYNSLVYFTQGFFHQSWHEGGWDVSQCKEKSLPSMNEDTVTSALKGKETPATLNIKSSNLTRRIHRRSLSRGRRETSGIHVCDRSILLGPQFSKINQYISFFVLGNTKIQVWASMQCYLFLKKWVVILIQLFLSNKSM